MLLSLQGAEPAKAPTAEEFSDEVMGPLMAEATKKLKKDKKIQKELFSKNEELLYSFDNASIHTATLKASNATGGVSMLSSYGFDEDRHRLPLSAYSPDLHKVIESAHGRAAVAFEKWLYDHPGKQEISVYKVAFKRIFIACNQPGVIKKHVQSLPALYKWVHENDGKYPNKSMR
jgi:hypothetical protein